MGTYNGNAGNNDFTAHEEWVFWPFIKEWKSWDLSGRDGEDTLRGGPKNDTIGGDRGDDLLLGNDGDDAIRGSLGNDILLGGEGNDNLEGGFGADYLSGQNGNDDLSGSSGDDYIVGEDGNDTARGGSGRDFVYGGNGHDVLYGDGTFCEGDTYEVDGDLSAAITPLCSEPGETESDYISGGNGRDWLYGEWGNDTLIGGAGSDNLEGGDGNDRLQGYGDDTSSQFDQMTGGEGADTFILGDAFRAFSGFASILDFDWAEGDKIQVHGNLEDYAIAPFFNGVVIRYQGNDIGIVANTNNVIPSVDFIFV